MTPSKSVKKFWEEYFRSIGQTPPATPVFENFCDNKVSANKLAALVARGVKRATASSLWTIEKEGAEIPSAGRVCVIVDWDGEAVCIIQVVKVSIIPFNLISKEQAHAEGEGDLSLEYWRRVHTEFFMRELNHLGLKFNETMPVVFEEFVKVFPKE